jgi:hypothetical protein
VSDAWKPTQKWGPRRSTGSQPIPVESVNNPNDLGIAKKRGMTNEKLASAIAALIGVRVPTVEWGKIENKEADGVYAVSRVHSSESIDMGHVRTERPGDFNSAKVQDALQKASGLVPFYAWINAGDQGKDDHLALDHLGNEEYAITGVDFESSFAWGAGDGGAVGTPQVPPALASQISREYVEKTVARIEGTTDDQIRSVVNALPDDLVSAQEKQRLGDGLIGRRSKVKQRMKDQGWHG